MSKQKNRIQRICAIDELEEKDLYNKGKLLLEIYRDVCWSAGQDAMEIKDIAGQNLISYGYASTDMDRVLVYLETFAPENGKCAFEEKMRNLFEVSWMIDVVEAAVEKVREFPEYGEMYYSILKGCYLDKVIRKEAELLDMLNIERSTFYRRKKEALAVFGFVIWGFPLAGLNKRVCTSRPDQNCEQLAFL